MLPNIASAANINAMMMSTSVPVISGSLYSCQQCRQTSLMSSGLLQDGQVDSSDAVGRIIGILFGPGIINILFNGYLVPEVKSGNDTERSYCHKV